MRNFGERAMRSLEKLSIFAPKKSESTRLAFKPQRDIANLRLTSSFRPPVAARAERSAVSSDEIQVNMQWTSKTPQIDPYWCS
jgi:hypothetical protein